MRSVWETDWNPEWVFIATTQVTECSSTNTRLPSPNPNHSSASGSSAIAGSGFSIAVSVSSNELPIRDVAASPVSTAATRMPST